MLVHAIHSSELILCFAGQTTEKDSTAPSAPAAKSYGDYDHLDNFVPKPARAADTDEPATTGSGGEQPQPKEEENGEKRIAVTEKDSSNSCCTVL